ncbi:MAG: hypothetical protein J6A01_08920 [Proteobacteria bacterium]|nr:hypothetical protein [Pseudomonadota bacterium]
MRLRVLKPGVVICPELKIDSSLDSHNGVAQYLASDKELGHALLHLLPDFEDGSLEKLQKISQFYQNHLGIQTRCGRYEEFLFLSEPFPLGEFMFEWLERRERILLPEALKHIIKLLKVLQEAHDENIFHGRITPKSILLERVSSSYGLRLMGFGVAQALTSSLQYDIDWFDYTFDLEGMSPAAVDIYGIAIVLMGLVSGEQGIDSFEATGLLPPILRGGLLQQAMERALALRIDSYPNVLTFSLDLEAALLEIDERQGEVYVGDLVGYESAVKSVSGISKQFISSESSGIWSSMFETLEQEERSSLLCSLTSLTAIKAVEDDEDDDITHVSSLPQAVLTLQRIKSSHEHEGDSTNVTNRPLVATEQAEVPEPTQNILLSDVKKPETTDDEHEITGRIERDDIEASRKTDVIPQPSLESLGEPKKEEKTEIIQAPKAPNASEAPQAPTTTDEKLASLQSLEAELKGDEDDEVDDAPTRVMKRPNYMTISFGQDPKDVETSIKEVLQNGSQQVVTITAMLNRIRDAKVIEGEIEVGHDIIYDENDPKAFPTEPKPSLKPDPTKQLLNNNSNTKDSKKHRKDSDEVQKTSGKSISKKGQKAFLLILMLIIIILFAVLLLRQFVL